MSPRMHAVRTGLNRGWTEFLLSVRSPQDQGFYLFTAVLVLVYLYFNRDTDIDGTTLPHAAITLPSSSGACSRSA